MTSMYVLLCESPSTFMVIAEKDYFHLFLMTFWCILARRKVGGMALSSRLGLVKNVLGAANAIGLFQEIAILQKPPPLKEKWQFFPIGENLASILVSLKFDMVENVGIDRRAIAEHHANSDG